MQTKVKKLVFILILTVCMTSAVSASIGSESLQVQSQSMIIKTNQKNDLITDALIHEEQIYIPVNTLVYMVNGSYNYDKINNILEIHSFRDFDEANPSIGEQFVYGQILSIDWEANAITIEEHYDDRHTYLQPTLPVSEDAVFILQRNNKQMNISFEDLRVGDVLGAVVNAEDKIRGIIIAD
ncbi:MAG: hypothetical protein ACOYVK_04270 [Bacillota bacterium]